MADSEAVRAFRQQAEKSLRDIHSRQERARSVRLASGPGGAVAAASPYG
jgi:hypothetical protein